MSKTLLIIATVFGICSAHPQFRKLDCLTEDKSVRGGPENSKCHLVIKDLEDEEPGRDAAEGDGCFSEEAGTDQRVYCDMICPKSHAVFHSKSLNHRACFKFHTYGVRYLLLKLEQRGEDWFLWRSGKCLNSTAVFDVGCKFDAPFKTQFASDKEIFARLKARKA
ncbi:unnamed protein product [Anisakis simplex]|uniref:Secreted protein n=1 Tax=Anisakis simplex TaxID=6269 RepID=A0A158PNP9_ANISI|nr:unnamed protein product [Anisakis simplex]